MADNQPPLTAEQIAYLEAQERIRLQQRQVRLNEIIEDGHQDYGKQIFDENSQRVAGLLGGERMEVFKEILPRVHAYAPELVNHYADNETAASELAKAPTVEDMAMHMIKTASQMAPHGNVRLGERRPRSGGGYSEADWKTGYAQANCTDAQLDKHIADRTRAKRQRGWG